MMTNENLMTATQMAEAYGLKSAVAFNKLMVKCGILQVCAKGYVIAEKVRAEAEASVWMKPIEKNYFLPNGIRATKKVAAWTEAGQMMIRRVLQHHGIVPVAEQVSLF